MSVYTRKASSKFGASNENPPRRNLFALLWDGMEVALSLQSTVSLLSEITDVLNVPFISLVWLSLPQREVCSPARPL
jgi:hypothetical protein